MTAKSYQSRKILINCNDGKNNLERATVAFVLAVSCAQSATTAMFITSDAAELCVKGKAQGLQAPGYDPLNGLINNFVESGGKIWLCPVCAKAKGISQSDLRDGVELAGAPKTMEFIAQGAQVLA